MHPGCTKLVRMPKEEFKREVDRYLTESQLPVIEQALETAALTAFSDVIPLCLVARGETVSQGLHGNRRGDLAASEAA